MTISSVAVIGAGVMGANIAAHMANAGASVLLLDIVPEGADNRNVLAVCEEGEDGLIELAHQNNY